MRGLHQDRAVSGSEAGAPVFWPTKRHGAAYSRHAPPFTIESSGFWRGRARLVTLWPRAATRFLKCERASVQRLVASQDPLNQGGDGFGRQQI